MLCFRNSIRSGVNEVEKTGHCQKAAQNCFAEEHLKMMIGAEITVYITQLSAM